MILIGLSGLARSGKDTVADYLVKRHGFRKFALAEYIKQVAELAGWNGLKDERGRRYLQGLGDVMRMYDPNIMTKELETRIMGYCALIKGDVPICNGIKHINDGIEFDIVSVPKIVVSDVRLENEIRWVKDLGGSCWLVLRDVKTEAIPVHKTEMADRFDRGLFDFVFDNNGSFEALYSGVDMAVDRFLKARS